LMRRRWRIEIRGYIPVDKAHRPSGEGRARREKNMIATKRKKRLGQSEFQPPWGGAYSTKGEPRKRKKREDCPRPSTSWREEKRYWRSSRRPRRGKYLREILPSIFWTREEALVGRDRVKTRHKKGPLSCTAGERRREGRNKK